MSNIPTDLLFTKTHEWVKQEAEQCTIGITDHAQELLGDMVYVELPEVGRVISEGDEFAVVESVKAAADVYSPVSGVVIAVNQKVSEDPTLLNTDPYGASWLIKLKVNNPGDLEKLLDAKQYEQELAEEH